MSKIEAPPPDYEHWRRMARWSVQQAAALSMGVDPDAASSEEAKFQDWHVGLAKRTLLISNHVEAGRLPHYMAPVEFLSWAQSNGIQIAPALVEAIRTHGGEIADWRLECERLRAAAEVDRAAIDKLDTEIARLTAELADARRSGAVRPLRPKEVQSLLKMVLGMAIDRYGFDPRIASTPATQKIVDGLARAGIPIEDDTVRKWLRQAAEAIELPPHESGVG